MPHGGPAHRRLLPWAALSSGQDGFPRSVSGHGGAFLESENGACSRGECDPGTGRLRARPLRTPPFRGVASAQGRACLLQNLICSECGDEFALQSQLATHMEEHRQELAGGRPHACKACGKDFETPSQLKEHAKTHYKIRCEPLLGLGKRSLCPVLTAGALAWVTSVRRLLQK